MVSTNGTDVAEETVEEIRERRRREFREEQHRQRSNHDALINEFQPDAVEIEKTAAPGGARWTLYAVVGLIVAVVTWACWAEVDRIVVAQGELVTVDPPVVIDTKLSTPIASMNAKFGDRVPAGFLIATVDPTFSDADMKQLEAQKASLTAVIARLRAERDDVEFSLAGHENDRDWLMQYQLYIDRKREYAAEIRKFETLKETLEVQLENNKSEIDNNLDSYQSYRDYFEEMKKLYAKQSASKLELLQWELQANDARMKVVTGNSKNKELNKSLEANLAEMAAYQAKHRTEVVTDLVAATDQFSGVEQELNKAIRQNQFVELRVPDDLPYKEFFVLEVAEKSVGTVMQPGEPLFKLIPVEAELEVEVEIEGKDIGRVQTATLAQMESRDFPGGSGARIKLSSFPYQKHGSIQGAVRTISEGSFEQQAPGGISTGVTTYKARVRILKPYELESLPENFRLVPGMSATVDIKIGHRRVIEYFLDPLIRYGEALREP
ncbi:MAG: HlyD family type I secretion periplasmic adaptor subunit [Planctomycetota bacterium]